MDSAERGNDLECERMPYVQIEANLWAVMRYPKDHPVAMIVGLSNRDNVPLLFM